MNNPMINVKLNIDKNAVANSFSKAAHSYDQFAQLQRDIGNQLFRQLNNKSYKKTLDLGCGTGYFSAKLLKQNKTNDLICLDLSKGMLDYLKMQRSINAICIQGDMDQLPFSENNFDIVFSNLVLQWSNDLQDSLQQLRQSLVIGGELHFSTLLEGSLNELSTAWQCIDNKPHINTFITRSDIEQILAQIGFSEIQIQTKTITLYYSNVTQLMRSLKGIGANHVNRQNSAKLQGRSMIHKLEQAYKVLANQSGSLPLSYQVCFIKAIK
jgi:malonyl-CoA O-methyltransferase